MSEELVKWYVKEVSDVSSIVNVPDFPVEPLTYGTDMVEESPFFHKTGFAVCPFALLL